MKFYISFYLFFYVTITVLASPITKNNFDALAKLEAIMPDLGDHFSKLAHILEKQMEDGVKKISETSKSTENKEDINKTYRSSSIKNEKSLGLNEVSNDQHENGLSEEKTKAESTVNHLDRDFGHHKQITGFNSIDTSEGNFVIKSIGGIRSDRKPVFSTASKEKASNKESLASQKYIPNNDKSDAGSKVVAVDQNSDKVVSRRSLENKNTFSTDIVSQNKSGTVREISGNGLLQDQYSRELELKKPDAGVDAKNLKDSRKINAGNTTLTTSKADFARPKESNQKLNIHKTLSLNEVSSKNHQKNLDHIVGLTTSTIGLLVNQNELNRMISQKPKTEKNSENSEDSKNKITSSTSRDDHDKQHEKNPMKETEAALQKIKYRENHEITSGKKSTSYPSTSKLNDFDAKSPKPEQKQHKKKGLPSVSSSTKIVSSVQSNSKKSLPPESEQKHKMKGLPSVSSSTKKAVSTVQHNTRKNPSPESEQKQHKMKGLPSVSSSTKKAVSAAQHNSEKSSSPKTKQHKKEGLSRVSSSTKNVISTDQHNSKISPPAKPEQKQHKTKGLPRVSSSTKKAVSTVQHNSKKNPPSVAEK